MLQHIVYDDSEYLKVVQQALEKLQNAESAIHDDAMLCQNSFDLDKIYQHGQEAIAELQSMCELLAKAEALEYDKERWNAE